MMRRLLSIFSVNDPGWGNSPRSNDNKGDAAGSKDGNAGSEGAPPAEEQGASANPPTSKPEPGRKPVGNGPPDLDELWRDFNDRLSNLFGGKKGPGRPSGGWDGKPNPNPNQNNDRDPILSAIGGVVPTASISGYRQEDVTMDGNVKYTGGSNDRDPILANIGGIIPTNIRLEQLP
jgi:membrane protease subunit HflK